MNDPISNWGNIQTPYSQEAEEATIGAILVNSVTYFAVAGFLKADDFFILRHRYIWETLTRLHERGEPIDYLTVTKELKDVGRLSEIGGPAYITQLINTTPTSVHAEVYGRLVERAAVRRRLMAASDEIKSLALNEELTVEQVIADAESKLFDVTERKMSKELIPMREAVSDYFDRIEFLMANHNHALGVPSGFKDLDKLLGGFQKSDLIIFAGRPGMGKCVAAGTLIPTEHGIVPIETLLPQNINGSNDDDGGVYYPLNMGVQTPEGIKQTSHFYDSGMRPTLRFQTRAGYSLTGTQVHPVLVLSSSGHKIWKPLSELNCGDYVAVQSEEVVSYKTASPNVSGTYVQSPTKLQQIAEYAPVVYDLLEPRFYWDEVVNIEDAGIQHCYDLTIPDGHAFVANGIVNHNTSFMLSAALNMARLGQRIAIFSMEMGVEQIVQRLISMESAINSQSLRLGQLNQQEWARFVHAAGNLSKFPIYIDDSAALNPLELRTKCLRMQREHGLDLVVVDYLQLMNAGGTYENNRVQEVSYISRNMKELAREFNVPILSAAQLSRAVEQRQDKRPQLSDLRESGCLSGDSLVYLPDEGRYSPIRELCGKANFNVASLNTATYKLEASRVTNAFFTGVKPVFRLTTQLGRTIRATANHQFLTINGWKRLDELTSEDHIALPRHLSSPSIQTMSNAELGLLGHLIGDGCTLPSHALQYTTREIDLAQTVSCLVTKVFGDQIKPRIYQEPRHNWYQVFLAPTQHLTHGVRNPVGKWLENLSIFGLRSYEKYVPQQVFTQPAEAIACFLRHLWATDGCIRTKATNSDRYPVVYYASSSERLARDVQSLLLRLQINARLTRVAQISKGPDQYHVTVTGVDDLQQFVEVVQAVGEYKNEGLEVVAKYLATHPANPNRDIIPKHVWRAYAVPAMQVNRMTGRQMQAELGNAYCGTGLYKQNISRGRASRLAEVVKSQPIAQLASSDVYWDKIAYIEADGETDVYDLTVPGNSNFVVNDLIAHNSLEQDSDIVMFLYRDDMYNEASEFPNQADIIISKHRNGPTGTVSLYFEKTLTKFMNAAERSVDLSHI